MIDVVVIISIHLVYNCKHVQHHLGISAVLLTHPSSPKTSLSGCTMRTVFCIFIPPAESTVFCVLPLLLTHLPRPDGQMDSVHSSNRYTDIQVPDSQSKSPTKLSTQCALHSILMLSLLCSRLLSSVLCVFSFFLSLSLSRFSFTVRKDLELRLQFRFFNNLHRKSTRIQ